MSDLSALVAVADALGLQFSARPRQGAGRWLLSVYRSDGVRFRAELWPEVIDYELEADGFPYRGTLPRVETALRKWAGA